MSIIDLYSAESWSISTVLCVLSGNNETDLFSAYCLQGDHSPDNVKSLMVRGTRHVKCYSHHAHTSTKYQYVWKYTVYKSFRQLFPDKTFSQTFPWILVKSLTFPWQLSNSLTFHVFEVVGHPVSEAVAAEHWVTETVGTEKARRPKVLSW